MCSRRRRGQEEIRNPIKNNELRISRESGGGGNRTQCLTKSQPSISATKPEQSCANTCSINALTYSSPDPKKQKPTLPAHQKDISTHEKCVTCVQQTQTSLPDDLREVVDAWKHLPDVVKKGILSMVQAVKQQ